MGGSSDILALLEKTEFFRDSAQSSRERLAGICTVRSAAKKELIFSEGEQGEALYLLGAGAVSLFKTTADGREVVIKVVAPGELFAEVILFEQDRYPVTARAITPSRLFLLPRQRFYSLLDNTDFRNDFIGMLMKKQRYLADRIRFLTANDVEERFFIFFQEQYGGRDIIVPDMSNKDIAAAIGTTPETYSRLLVRLAGEGKLAVEGRTIRLIAGRQDRRHPSG